MNELNYCTLQAAKRLHEAGIVMKTDFTWGCQVNKDGSKRWTIQPIDCHFANTEPEYPAPSMAECWRELPDSHGSSTTLIVEKHYDSMIAGYFDWEEEDFTEAKFRNENPTDALIDLLIWLRGKKEAV